MKKNKLINIMLIIFLFFLAENTQAQLTLVFYGESHDNSQKLTSKIKKITSIIDAAIKEKRPVTLLLEGGQYDVANPYRNLKERSIDACLMIEFVQLKLGEMQPLFYSPEKARDNLPQAKRAAKTEIKKTDWQSTRHIWRNPLLECNFWDTAVDSTFDMDKMPYYMKKRNLMLLRALRHYEQREKREGRERIIIINAGKDHYPTASFKNKVGHYLIPPSPPFVFKSDHFLASLLLLPLTYLFDHWHQDYAMSRLYHYLKQKNCVYFE